MINNTTAKYLCHSSLIIRYYINQENPRKIAIDKLMLKITYLNLESVFSLTPSLHINSTTSECYSEDFTKIQVIMKYSEKMYTS